MLLAGDIGGTKTNLSIVVKEAGPRQPLAQSSFRSANYSSLETLVEEFLAGVTLPVESAVFGVAGPVVAGRAHVTNLPWVVDADALCAALHLRTVRLLNDLEAIAYAIPSLVSEDLYALNTGSPVAGGTIAVIAPGTGLGEAFLTWDGRMYRPYASEGGHADFAPTSADQIGLLQYLTQRYDHVSCERVCSGSGLPHIYSYLRDTGYSEEPDWLVRELSATPDPAPVIVNAALGKRTCELCRATLRMFVSILASESGNLALKVLATGGVYVGGGIPPRILPALATRAFVEAFRSKGRFVELLSSVPVQVILNPEVALYGAAYCGLDRNGA